MPHPKPYTLATGELRRTDEALMQETIPAAELRAYYRTEAARLWAEACNTEAAEIRATLLELAEQADKLAASFGR